MDIQSTRADDKRKHKSCKIRICVRRKAMPEICHVFAADSSLSSVVEYGNANSMN